ncbi:MAG: methyltransferase domain-containing protein [Gemmataceae bacterium]|nr:methyltransferase domain-containing protein [Gemmataceae bacterium]
MRCSAAVCSLMMLFLLLSEVAYPQQIKDKKEGRYEWKSKHDPNGIGKFYMGREIAHVMGHLGASWLERPQREEEEAPSKLIEALNMKEGDVVADIGAGTGYHVFRMAPLVGKTGKIYAVDIQPEMLDMIKAKATKKKVENIELILGKEDDPKLPEEKIDLILMVDVYHEFAYPYEMTEKMIKALKPSGRLVFVEFRKEDEKVLIKEVHKMSEAQVLKEMAEFKELRHIETYKKLPWQHMIFFEKKALKK